MRNKFPLRRLLFSAILLLSMAFLFPNPNAYAAVKLSKKTITLVRKDKYKLKVKGAKSAVKWSTWSPYVATVNKKGVVTALNQGTTTIYAKVGKKKLACKVNVVIAHLFADTDTLMVGESLPMEVTIKPSKQKVKWSSSKKSVATVNKKGVVKAKKPGKTTITATIGQSKLTKTITVKECQYFFFAGKESGRTFTIKDGGQLYYDDIALTLSLSTDTKKKINYTSSNPNVIRFTDNKMVLVGDGTTTITASNGDYKDSQEVVVKDQRELEGKTLNIVIRPLEGFAEPKFKEQFDVTIVNQQVENVVSATSSHPEVATVKVAKAEDNREVYAFSVSGEKLGSTDITVKTKERSFSIKINVIPYRVDDDLSKTYTGVSFGPFGTRYHGMKAFYDGRIAETAEEFQAALKNSSPILKEFFENYTHEGMNDREKVAAIYRYAGDNHVKYGGTTYTRYSWYGFMHEHLSVCGGASEAVAMLCKAMGLQAYTITDKSVDHGWNIVKIDNQWQSVDFIPPRSGMWGEKFDVGGVYPSIYINRDDDVSILDPQYDGTIVTINPMNLPENEKSYFIDLNGNISYSFKS